MTKQPAGCTRSTAQVCVPWSNYCVRECGSSGREQPVHETGQGTLQTARPATAQRAHRAARALKVWMLKADFMKTTLYTGASRGAPPWPISPHCARLTTDCSYAASDERENVTTVTTCHPTQTRQGWLWERRDDGAKRRILFAGLVTRMGNEIFLKRAMLGEVDGGKGFSGGQ